MSPTRVIRLFTSRMSGTLSMNTSSCVSRVAQMICHASFFARCGVMVPCRLCPPSMMNDDIVFRLKYPPFRLKGDAELFFHCLLTRCHKPGDLLAALGPG